MDGVEIYPLISLVIFMLFFAGLLFYVVKLSKPLVKHMAELPLEDDTTPSTSNKLAL